jgi:hypothetical protein
VGELSPDSPVSPGVFASSDVGSWPTCNREDVPVADSGHGDDDPVEGGGDGGEARVLVLLYEVGQAAEDQARDADEEDEEAKLLVAVLQRVRDSL